MSKPCVTEPCLIKLAAPIDAASGVPTVKLAPYDLGGWGYLCWPLVATGVAADLGEVHDIVKRLLATSPQHPGRVYWLFHRSVAFACADDCEHSQRVRRGG